jgi:hypothetical protein
VYSIFFNFFTIRTITASIKITERKTSTIYTRFILGNPLGGENPTKLLQYRFVNKYNVSLQERSHKIEDNQKID